MSRTHAVAPVPVVELDVALGGFVDATTPPDRTDRGLHDPADAMQDLRGHRAHVRDLEEFPGRLAYLATPESLLLIEEALDRLCGAWWPELDGLLGVSLGEVERLTLAVSTRWVVTRMHDPDAADGGRIVVVLTSRDSSVVDFALRLSSWIAPADERDVIRSVLDQLDADTPLARGRGVLLESEVDPAIGLRDLEAFSWPSTRHDGRGLAIGAAMSMGIGLAMVITGVVSMGTTLP